MKPKTQLLLQLEAMIFASESAVSAEELWQALQNYSKEESIDLNDIQTGIDLLQQTYKAEDRAFELIAVNGGYQFYTKTSYHDLVASLLKQKNQRKLSKAALETLAIIAYQQPVTKAEVEKIRGVNCDYAVQKLLEKELIEIRGRSQEAGRPLLYATSGKFMQHFGLNSMKDLPKLKELQPETDSIGQLQD